MASKLPPQIDTPIQYLKGVGPKLAVLFERRGISTVGQLLEWIPRGYEDRRRARSISTLVADERVSFVANIQGTRTIPLGSGYKKIYEVVVADSSGRISLKFFRLPYRGYLERLKDLNQVRVSGKVINYRGKLEIHHPEVHPVEDVMDESESDIILPLYTETEGLSPQKIRKTIVQAIQTMGTFISDPLPKWVLEKYKLMPRAEAIKSLHVPDPKLAESLAQFSSPAHLRLIFEEFFWLELKLAIKRSQIRSENAPGLSKPSALAIKLQEYLPFKLTGAQLRAYEEIQKDLSSPRPMHRLVQGDVGCGKTLVAFMAALKVVDNGFKTALMAPTEILAEQHYVNAKKFLEPLGIRVSFLTGSMKAKEKEEVYAQLKAGEYDLVVGTHALIQEKVELCDLALAIIDEQHRFGVDQRAKLKAKTRFSDKALKSTVSSIHFLVMTATPIPRTLAMTAYGDLDFTIIDELPPGRTPVVTKKVFPNKRDNVFNFMVEEVKKGRQAYIVYPLIEESEKLDLKNAVDGIKDLSMQYPDVRFKLLHGKMSADEKDVIMRAFKNAEFDVLVSTTVIEVGVDVPNASLMIIEEATRFGLSQLHQLRGRVGRGGYKSYCVLMLGHALSEIARKRAEIMEQTTDGFVIAEADLELRGPGEFMGTRQSGLPGFKYGHLVRDQSTLKLAREAAFECLRRDPGLTQPENQEIKKSLQKLIDQSVG